MEIINIILKCLACLSKYGVIDILFGIGIFSFIARTLRRKKIKEIDGVELFPKFDITLKIFKVEIQNNSKETLYIYRSYFQPGFWRSSKIGGSSLKIVLQNFLYLIWTTKFPLIDEVEKINIKGQLVPMLYDLNGDPLKPPFLEAGASAYYKIQLKKENENLKEENLPRPGEAGILTLHIIYGITPKFLEVKV